jgi:hypothetical protein
MAKYGREMLIYCARRMESLKEKREKRYLAIKDCFRDCAERAITNRTLWPYLADEKMSAKIGDAEKSFYKEKVVPAASLVKYFEVHPVTFNGLQNLTFIQI